MTETRPITLAAFLLARIVEDQVAAQAALERGSVVYDRATLRDRKFIVADSTHIPRWRPARVLAECEAKRRIVVRAGEILLAAVPMAVHLARQTLVDLARPYADHADYRTEWRS